MDTSHQMSGGTVDLRDHTSLVLPERSNAAESRPQITRPEGTMICRKESPDGASGSREQDTPDVPDTKHTISVNPRSDTDDFATSPNSESSEDTMYSTISMTERERVSTYKRGGHHPVHLGDVLGGRYKVKHKLGAGTSALVWFCQDIISTKWRAVKILTDKSSSDDVEENMYNHLQSRASLEEIEANHIAMPLHKFRINGPNGRHLCVVMPVFGTYDATQRHCGLAWLGTKERCRQIVQAVQFLHHHGICHGGLELDKIMVKFEGIDELDETQAMDSLGEPLWQDLKELEETPGPNPPEYCVKRALPMWHRYLSPKSIMLVDLREAYFAERIPKYIGTPLSYAAPEILFSTSMAPKPGRHSDIWSLACIIYEICLAARLFKDGSYNGIEFMIRLMEQYLGPLPKHYEPAFLDMFTPIPKLNSDGTPNLLGLMDIQEMLVSSAKRAIGASRYSNLFEAQISKLSDVDPQEVLCLADLLRKMLKYDAAERITIDEVFSHPWLRDS